MPAVEQTSHPRQLGINFDRILTYRWHVQTTALKVQERPVKSLTLWLQWVPNNATSSYCISRVCVQCHHLWTRPHNNGKDKSVKAKCSAEWGNENHVKSQQARNARDHLQIKSTYRENMPLSSVSAAPPFSVPPSSRSRLQHHKKKKRV